MTAEQQARLLDSLYDEALATCVDLGCSCTPKFQLTGDEFGPLALPAWISDHDDDCAMLKTLGGQT